MIAPRKRMSPAELQAVYDEILACFSAHGISVSAAKASDEHVVEGPASILFKVRPGNGVRYLRFREIGVKSIIEHNSKVEQKDRLPWWIIVLDEYADLTSDSQGKKDIEHELKRLAQKARAAGIHVVIAIQKPSAEVISTNLRSNLPALLALRVKSGTESRVIIDSVGAETLNGKGDTYFKADGKLRGVQCAWVDTTRMP